MRKTASPERSPGESAAANVRVARARPRVSLPWVTLGLLLIVGCALAGWVMATTLQQRQTVLAVAQPIGVGQVITESDLTTAELTGASGVAAIPAADQARVVGQPAAMVLLPGMLLTDSTLGEPTGLGPNEALTGVTVGSGRLPPGVGAGAHVQVLDTGAASNPAQPATGGETEATVLGRAIVVSVDAAEGGQFAGGGSVVTLKLGLDAAAEVTSVAAAGRLALVLVTEGS